MPAARVHAIVLNYFGAEKTRRCIETLLDEDITALTVVDNSANVGEMEKLTEVRDELRSKASFLITLTANTENLGFGRSINAVVRQCRHSDCWPDYFFLMNNDAWAGRTLVARLVSAMRGDRQRAIVGPKVRQGGEVITTRWYYRIFGHVSDKANDASAVPYISGSCLLVDSDLATPCGLFDEDFFMYGEDIWLSWHALRRGRSVYCVEDAEVQHQGTGSSRQGNFFYEYHTARGHVLLGRKMARHSIEVPVLIAGRMGYLFARAVLRSWRFRCKGPLKAFASAWFAQDVRPA